MSRNYTFRQNQPQRVKWTRDTRELAPNLEINFTNWEKVRLYDGDGYLTGNLELRNAGRMTLKNLSIKIKLEDTSYGYNATFCGFDGKPTGQVWEHEFGSLPENKTTTPVKVAWKGVTEQPTDPGEIESEIFFHFTPKFEIDYENDGKRYSAKSVLLEQP